jgi:peptide/nickel transport system permease protein
MIAYIIRRLVLLPILLVGTTILLFVMVQLLDPYQRLALYVKSPAQLKGGKEQLDRMLAKYGLTDPLPVQYGRWVTKIVQGDLGWSETAHMPVLDGFVHRFPATAELTLYTFPLIVFLSIWLGVKAAVYHNRWFDHGTRFFSTTGYSIPTFVLGILLLMLFYGLLNRRLTTGPFADWFAPGRLSQWAAEALNDSAYHQYTGMVTIDALLNGRLDIFWNGLGHLILPVITLATVSIAGLLRVMRSSMLETLRQDYVRTARSKGLPERVVIYKHARRNALIPVATLVAYLIIGLLGGVLITETIFNYPGIGQWAGFAALSLDIPAVLFFLVFSVFSVVLANLVVDLLYTVLDPRVRLS